MVAEQQVSAEFCIPSEAGYRGIIQFGRTDTGSVSVAPLTNNVNPVDFVSE